MSSHSSLDEGLHAVETEGEQEESVVSESAYASAIEELLLSLKHLEKEATTRKESRAGGGGPRGLFRSRLGPADRFAVMVSGFSLFILLFFFVSKASRFVRKKARALRRKTWRGAPFPSEAEEGEEEPASFPPPEEQNGAPFFEDNSEGKGEAAGSPSPAPVKGGGPPPTGGGGLAEGPSSEDEEEVLRREARRPWISHVPSRLQQPRFHRKGPTPSRLIAGGLTVEGPPGEGGYLPLKKSEIQRGEEAP
ncbi:hypothetical protein Esti_005919 [Eimeria stiedai]